MQIQFENITDKQINELKDIYNYYVLNTNCNLHEKPLSEVEMKSILYFNDPRSGSFTIFLDSKIVGYVTLAKYRIHKAYKDTGEVAIYLDKNFLHKGIGKEALKFIEKIAIEKKYHTLVANISSDNITSIKLFETFGYNKSAHFKEVAKKFGNYLDICSYQKIINE